MAIRIYNTLTRRKEEFVPLAPGKVGIYSCGPTVYDYFHIGNARAFVVPDVIRRYLEYRGYDVTLVQNITDIEDKIIRRAAERGVSTQEIVDEYTQAFYLDRDALGIRPPNIQPRATEHVRDIIKMIEVLIERGLAYASGGDVYYDVSEFREYGKLSNQNLDDLKAGARAEVGESKDAPLDFALWKAAKPGEPAWESPWGPGRPGWHIECSVMSSKYLGETFDIHTGGVDLVFPHHENEIAQSEGASGKPFVRYWVHNGYVNIDGQRMGKSLGNFKTVRDILKQYPGRVVRYFLIANHYRKPINFSDEELGMCARALSRLEDAVANAAHAAGLNLGNLDAVRAAAGGADAGVLAGGPGSEPADSTSGAKGLERAVEDARKLFEESMDDDFNTAGAMAALHDLATGINTYVNEKMPGDPEHVGRAAVARAVLAMLQLGNVIGVLEPEAFAQAIGGSGASATCADERSGLVSSLIDLLIEVRTEARASKHYSMSDKIRDRLGELGVIIEDTRDGVRWKFAAK
ncbi:MAG: cysteine--tRNA ligase [Firmicutes bacterium]|jgi:cysteinyl-tRNA synthetase|nr:cysteine--tRNA ligase [Bacillota bacterium]